MERKLNVLILEDSDDDALLLVRKLSGEGGYEPLYERVDTPGALRKALEGRGWDIIISDHSMPQFSAIDALRELRDRGLDIPVIIVSGTIPSDAAVAAMKEGASDFIMKDDLTRLLPAIERELREARSRREKRIAEDRFHEAQKMESIGRLAGGVAHDFNNLLTAIMGYANLLSSGPMTTWREDLDEIRKAAERAAALTRQLLAFSRRQALQPRVLDLNAETLDLERMLRRMVGEDIKWELSLAKDLGNIKADAGQIQQVLMNLVLNARDAMPGGGTLTIRTQNLRLQEAFAVDDVVLPPGRYVTLSIEDTGVGIDPTVKARLFEPFFTTKEKGKGTGLGLAVVYGVVKQSGGMIVVETALGKGTGFRVYFPAVAEAADARPEGPVSPAVTKGTETILVVDDDPAVRSVIKRVLGPQGYVVLEANDGERALELASARTETLHLLLTDMVLPGINGLELAKRMRTARPESKVLLISGYLDRDFGNFILDSKTPFLQKPFSPAALAALVREVLDG